jgi:hypothetical protein
MPNFVTIVRYRDLPEALLVQGKLESAGIASALVNAETIRTDWLFSNAIGGIGLQVEESEAEEATVLVAESIPQGLADEQSGETYDQPLCPRCGSLDIEYGRRRVAVILSWIALGFPLPLLGRLRWKCDDCAAEWIDAPEADTESDTAPKPNSD